MKEVIVNGLIAGPLGVFIGWGLALWQQRSAEKKARRERQLAQMQQFVVAVMELETARKVHRELYQRIGARFRMVAGLAAVEVWSAWTGRVRGWDAVRSAMAPTARAVSAWDRHGLDEAAALTTHFARVAAAGLPLGMAEDPAVASAAQTLMDISLEGRGEDAVNSGVKALRAAFYPGEATDSRTVR